MHFILRKIDNEMDRALLESIFCRSVDQLFWDIRYKIYARHELKFIQSVLFYVHELKILIFRNSWAQIMQKSKKRENPLNLFILLCDEHRTFI